MTLTQMQLSRRGILTHPTPQNLKHIMEDADKNFPNKVKAGDVIVAGKNFGCGSSRGACSDCDKGSRDSGCDSKRALQGYFIEIHLISAFPSLSLKRRLKR